jgi:predicted nucleic acid-binding Zn ribbon protein
VSDERACRACGAPLAAGADRCERCGTAARVARRRPTRWLLGGAAIGALFVAGIIVSAVDQSRGAATVSQDFQALLPRLNGQQVVICGVLGTPAPEAGALELPVGGPDAASDSMDVVVVVTDPGTYARLVPAGSIPAGTDVEVSATVRVVPGAGDARIVELVHPAAIQSVGTCPSEVVPRGS